MVDGLSATLRALSFIALFQAAGIATFVVLFGRMIPVTEAGTRRVGVLSALLAIAFLVTQYLLEAARMSGELAGAMDPTLQTLVLHSPTSTALAVRVAGLVLIALGLHGVGIAPRSMSIVGILLVVSAFALVGHTTSHPNRVFLSALLLPHLLIVAFWFGALLPLYRASVGESAVLAGTVTEAFSRLAVWIVPALLIAGVLLAAFLLPSIAALRTTYGELLLAKLAAFSLLMLLGALNKWRLGPALTRGEPRAIPLFRRTLAFEYALIAGTLSVTAVLTSFYSPD